MHRLKPFLYLCIKKATYQGVLFTLNLTRYYMNKLLFFSFFGLLLLFSSCRLGGTSAPGDHLQDTIPMLTQLQSCSRLYTTEYQFRIIVAHSDTVHFTGKGLLGGLRVGLPMSSRHIAIPIEATIKGYIDMSKITEQSIHKEKGGKITLILPDPTIQLTATKVEHKQIRQFVKLLGRNFTDEELSSFERQGRDSIIAQLSNSGIIQNAQANAARILIPLLQRMGYKEENITITFRKDFASSDLRRSINNASTQEERP